MLFTYRVVCWDSSSTIFGICGTCGVVLGSGFQESCAEERPCPPGVSLVLAVCAVIHFQPRSAIPILLHIDVAQLPLTTCWNPGFAPEPLTLRCWQALSFASNAGSVKTDLYLYSFCALRGKFYELRADWQSPVYVQWGKVLVKYHPHGCVLPAGEDWNSAWGNGVLEMHGPAEITAQHKFHVKMWFPSPWAALSVSPSLWQGISARALWGNATHRKEGTRFPES